MKRRLLNLFPPDLRKKTRARVFRFQHELRKLQFLGLTAPQDGWPALLAISLPKSGTHLLTQILTGFSKIAPFADQVPFVYNSRNFTTGELLPAAHHLAYLRTIRPLDVVASHLVHHPEIVNAIYGNRFVSYFIYRDLRDVLVSYAYYFGDLEPNHRLYRILSPLTMEQRITMLINGKVGGEKVHDNVAELASVFMGWLGEPFVCSIRFEDLIHDRKNALGRIADHFLQRVDTLPATRSEIVDALQANIDPRHSPTFRSGNTGGWRELFTEEHKRSFKELGGDLLMQLGYEKNNDW